MCFFVIVIADIILISNDVWYVGSDIILGWFECPRLETWKRYGHTDKHTEFHLVDSTPLVGELKWKMTNGKKLPKMTMGVGGLREISFQTYFPNTVTLLTNLQHNRVQGELPRLTTPWQSWMKQVSSTLLFVFGQKSIENSSRISNLIFVFKPTIRYTLCRDWIGSSVKPAVLSMFNWAQIALPFQA